MSNQPDDISEFNRTVTEEFRANGGTVPSMGMDILILGHRGERSGTPYSNPLVFTTDGDRYVVIASNGGQPDHPQWYRNLVAHPDVEIEVGGDRLPVTARTATGAERDRLYQAQERIYPQFTGYAAATTRAIPVVVLEPR